MDGKCKNPTWDLSLKTELRTNYAQTIVVDLNAAMASITARACFGITIPGRVFPFETPL